MRFLVLSAALVAALLATRVPAEASILGVAGDFNGFVFGNLTAVGGDTEGRLAVGGNLQAQTYGVGSGGIGPAVPLTTPRTDVLVVGGNLNAIGNWQVFYGNAVYGTSVSGTPSTPWGATNQGTPVDFAAAQADLTAKSAYWGSLATSASINEAYGTLTLTATNPGLNVFNVSEALWESTHTKMIVNPFADATLLINIAGTDVAQTGGLFYNGTQTPSAAHSKVLFNYSDATALNISSTAVLGSVLAPHAALTLQSAGINGVGIVASASQTWGGEFHNFTFNGNLPGPTPVVPEPTSAAIFLLGTCGALLTTTRRR